MKSIKKKVIDLAKKNQTLRTMLRKAMVVNKKLYYNKCCKKNNISDNIILFESFMGRSYACSPKAIYEEMLKEEKFNNFEFVWFFKDIESKRKIENLKRATIIKYNSKEYYEYYSKAKYFVTNSRIPDVIKRREGQVYIQCWHGTPLKVLGYDIKVKGGNAMNSLDDIRHKYKVDSERYTYLLSPSKFTTEKLTSCFNLKENNPDAQVVEKGYPRNDFLYNYTEEDCDKIKKQIGIDNIGNKKIILYAPTWRDNQHQSGVGYTYELGVDFDKLQKELQDEYIILFRPHYFIANSFNFEKYKGFVYDVSKVDDINELYVVSDILITDYSSVFFDYANLKRPIIFYMYDFEEYKDELRGVYIGLEELPGKITKKESELIDAIKGTKEFKYDELYKRFNDKFNYLDDGNASKRVVEVCIK